MANIFGILSSLRIFRKLRTNEDKSYLTFVLKKRSVSPNTFDTQHILYITQFGYIFHIAGIFCSQGNNNVEFWCFICCQPENGIEKHYTDVIMSAMASQIINHRRLHCLLNCRYRRRSRKISELRVTSICVGDPPVSPRKRPVTRKCIHLMMSSWRVELSVIWDANANVANKPHRIA